VPGLLDEKAWLAKADSTHPVVAVSQVMDVAAPDASADRISLLARLISQRGYTAAELAYAAQELPFDDYLNSKLRYGKPIMPADFERVIEQVRTKRRLIGERIPEGKLDEVLLDIDSLCRDDFGVCAYDSNGQPLYTMKNKVSYE